MKSVGDYFFIVLNIFNYGITIDEIELFICIKMDLALNNQQRLICYETQNNK